MAAIRSIWFPSVMHTCPCGTRAYECRDLRGINDAHHKMLMQGPFCISCCAAAAAFPMAPPDATATKIDFVWTPRNAHARAFLHSVVCCNCCIPNGTS
eukprot:1142255-Pelagomonas_calceolata.AAC.4